MSPNNVTASSSLSKEKAWDQFVRGDESCFKKLFDCYFKLMYGYGIKLCNNREVVKDCIQELFKTIWERRDDLDHIESPKVYLFVSLRRKILKQQQSRRKLDGDLEEIDESAFMQFSKEEIIIRDEMKYRNKQKLQEALNQLSKRQKEVVFLHFYSGMSYGEIQQILSINRQSVRNHIYRAMESLRSILGNENMKLVI